MRANRPGVNYCLLPVVQWLKHFLVTKCSEKPWDQISSWDPLVMCTCSQGNSFPSQNHFQVEALSAFPPNQPTLFL